MYGHFSYNGLTRGHIRDQILTCRFCLEDCILTRICQISNNLFWKKQVGLCFVQQCLLYEALDLIAYSICCCMQCRLKNPN
jgi:hypothetical protein